MLRPLPAAGLAALSGLAASVLPAPATQAQTIGENLLTATISQSLEADTNVDLDPDSPGTSFFAETRFGFGLRRETARERLTFGFNTGARAIAPAEGDAEFTWASPWTASAGYGFDWAGGAVQTDLAFRQRRFDFLADEIVFREVVVPGWFGDEIVFVPDDLVRRERDVTERRYDAGISLVLAPDAPSSYRLALRGTAIDFSGDGGFVGRQEARGDASWRLRLTPRISAAANADFRLTDIDNAADTTIRTADVDIGLVLEPAADFSLGFGVGIGEEVRRATIDGDRRTIVSESGLTLRANLAYRPTEDLDVAATLRVSDAGDRVEGSVRARYAYPLGSLSASLTQSFTGSALGDQVRVTRLGLGFSRALDDLTGLTLGAAYGIQSNRDADVADIHRADLSASVSRTIAPDLSASLGYRFRTRDQDERATSHAVFVTLARSFETPF
jgi:hypothetical protein